LSKHKDNSMEIFGEAFKTELAKAMGTSHAIMVKSHSRTPNPITVTEGVLDPDTWAKLIVDRGSAAQDYWKDRTLHPSKDPIAAGIKAEKKFKDRMETVLKNEARKKGLEKTNLTEYGEDVDATPSTAYGDGLKNKSKKITRKISRLQPLVEGLRKAIAAMPEDTDPQREAKMRAARRGMILVGQAMKGIVGPADIEKAIKGLVSGAGA